LNPRIGTLTIERFRALQNLKIEGLGRVNLITGRNNTGKSSVLEALRIFASDASLSVISQILRYREEDVEESEGATRSAEGDDLSMMISSLFSGFPSLAVMGEPIVISTNGFGQPKRLSMSVGRFLEERESDGTRRLIPLQAMMFPEAEALIAISIGTEKSQRILPLDRLRRIRVRSYRGDLLEKPRWPSVFMSPHGSEHTGALGPLWDSVALSDREKDVVDALKIITPDIEAVTMIGGEGPTPSRTAFVRSKNIPRPVPLRSFGDGLNRLFGIILSLVNAKDGLLLIDEFENGMHHTVQLDLWRVIFKLARRLDIQVFATSHSWDSVESFQKAANEDPAEGVLVRLTRKGDDIIPTLFRENELAVATRDRIDVR
jgi:hypothetical protein